MNYRYLIDETLLAACDKAFSLCDFNSEEIDENLERGIAISHQDDIKISVISKSIYFINDLVKSGIVAPETGTFDLTIGYDNKLSLSLSMGDITNTDKVLVVIKKILDKSLSIK
jgi:hypothetical protein